MTAGTRALAVLGLVAAFAGLFFLCTNHGPSGGVDSPSARVDSLRAVVVHLGDSITLERAAHAHDLDSLQALLQRAPDTVWQLARRLVHDTVNTGRIDTLRLVSRLVLDDSACHMGIDSVRGDLILSRARGRADSVALALCWRSLGELPSPSSGGTRWTVSGVLQADGEALRPGLGLDWRPYQHLQAGVEGYVRGDGTRPGGGMRVGFSW